jgi:branched-chain amino acid aminotransferase
VIGTGAQLGGQMPTEALLFILVVEWPDIATQSPPGAMKKEALKLMTSENGTTRAWPGGFGSAKIGANYGPSYRTNLVAQRRGFDQVLWLFGEEGEVTEAGTSNFFVVWQNKETGRKELVTAPVTHDIILNGVTRRSVLELARERLTGSYKDGGLEYGGLDVVERKFTGHEIERKWKEGCLYDAFVTGTTVSLQLFSWGRAYSALILTGDQ